MVELTAPSISSHAFCLYVPESSSWSGDAAAIQEAVNSVLDNSGLLNAVIQQWDYEAVPASGDEADGDPDDGGYMVRGIITGEVPESYTGDAVSTRNKYLGHAPMDTGEGE